MRDLDQLLSKTFVEGGGRPGGGRTHKFATFCDDDEGGGVGRVVCCGDIVGIVMGATIVPCGRFRLGQDEGRS